MKARILSALLLWSMASTGSLSAAQATSPGTLRLRFDSVASLGDAVAAGLAQAAPVSPAAPCTSNCNSILVSWPATAQPVPNCSATVTASCFSGYQVTLTPPPNTGAAVVLSPTQTGGPTSTGTTWTAAGQLYTGTWTVAALPMGVGVPSPTAPVTTTMVYAPSLVCPPSLLASPTISTVTP